MFALNLRSLRTWRRRRQAAPMRLRRCPCEAGQPEPRASVAAVPKLLEPRMPSAIERNCGRAPRCRPIAVWSSCTKRKQRSQHFGSPDSGKAAFMRRAPGPTPLATLAISDPSHSPKIGLALAFPADAARKRAGPALMRLANGQQNAYRRDPSGGNPGGGSTWQPRRRIRLRVGKP